jgi:pimeloyl-ACP methyl ester carboxylesterase
VADPQQLEVRAGGHRLVVVDHAASAPRGELPAPLVVLHGGLDSTSTLKDFPGELAAATRRRVIAYDRMGHGRSDPLVGPRPDEHRQEEAATLVELLDGLGIERAVLVGHSDGGAISLLAAGRDPARVEAVVALAPQLVNHPAVQAGIADAVEAYRRGSLREALRPHHIDADALFEGWSGVWLRAVYRTASVEGDLARIACPVAVVCGADDPYGFRPNVELLVRSLTVGFELTVLERAGHLPHHRARSTVLAVTRRLLERPGG